MLDIGLYIAQAIYFFLWYVAQQWWELNRALLSIAILTESINQWLLDNVGYFVQAVVYALEAPLAMMLVLAIAMLGFWYLLNSLVATQQFVDPGKLLVNGFLVLFFFASPLVAIDALEGLRLELTNGIQDGILEGAIGEIFDTDISGTDDVLPEAIPDVYPTADGIVGSFDLVGAFLLIGNANEIANFEFPADFEAEYFGTGDPSQFNLSDESERAAALAMGWGGIKRQITASFSMPTVIADHILRLVLTGAAMLLYAGVPFAMLLAFFVYTQAFLLSYIHQYIKLLIETFLSVIIASLMVGVIVIASQQGVGFYIGANILTVIVLFWRIQSAFKLVLNAVDSFGGASLTGGASGRELTSTITKTAGAGAGVALTAVTGGTALALAGGLGAATSRGIQQDNPVVQGQTRQLKALAGYTLGKNKLLGSVIENSHEARTFIRGFRSGGMATEDTQQPDTLDYLRVGKSLSGKGSSPWMTMGLSPGFRAAYDELGGRRSRRQLSMIDPDEMGENQEDLQNQSVQLPQNDHKRLSKGRLVADMAARKTAEQFSASEQLIQLNQNIKDLIRALTDPAAFQPEENGILNKLPDEDERSSRRKEETFTFFDETQPNDLAQKPTMEDGTTAVQSFNVELQTLTVENATEQSFDNTATVVNFNTEEDSDTLTKQQTPHEQDEDETVIPRPTTEQTTPTWQPASQPSLGVVTILAAAESERESVQRVMIDLIDDMGGSNHIDAEAAYQEVADYAGKQTAETLQKAIHQHHAAGVQRAVNATVELVETYTTQGLTSEQILHQFQSGVAADEIRTQTCVRFSNEQVTAVADAVLMPRRIVDKEEIATAVYDTLQQGLQMESGLAAQLGTPQNFGGDAGSIRVVMAGASQMKLSRQEMTKIVKIIRQGLAQDVKTYLLQQGYARVDVDHFVDGFDSLPDRMQLPQTTAFAPGDTKGFTAHTKKDVQ